MTKQNVSLITIAASMKITNISPFSSHARKSVITTITNVRIPNFHQIALKGNSKSHHNKFKFHPANKPWMLRLFDEQPLNIISIKCNLFL